jgi:hypothetical protein
MPDEATLGRLAWCALFHRQSWIYHREHDKIYGWWCPKCLDRYRAQHDPDDRGRCYECGERVPD